MQVSESVRMALGAIRGNKLRAGLTLLSIAIGVFAIVGVSASVGALNAKVDDQLSAFGSNSFIIQKFPGVILSDRAWRKFMNRKDITLRQAMQLKDRLVSAQEVGMSNAVNGAVAKYGDETTDPDVQVFGGDDSFIVNSDFAVESGRALDPADVQSGSDVAVLGADIAGKLFKGGSPLGKTVRLNGFRYNVIGVLKAKGAAMGMSQDNFVLVPITSAAKHFFDEWGTSVQLTVRAGSKESLQETIDQAIGLMRIIRRLDIGEENDFEIITSESLNDTFGNLTSYISYFGMFCGGMALVAAGVGIMNIMLVSVKERTREIGIRKAVGATRSDILSQFVIEAVTICQFGAAIGILLGLLAGVGIGILIDVTPPIPWDWVAGAIGASTLIGMVFGIYPAWKASRLDPIEALRYE